MDIQAKLSGFFGYFKFEKDTMAKCGTYSFNKIIILFKRKYVCLKNVGSKKVNLVDEGAWFYRESCNCF